MLDHHDSRMWADHGQDFSAWAADALAKALIPFQRLNAIQFDAPWRRGPRRANRAGH